MIEVHASITASTDGRHETGQIAASWRARAVEGPGGPKSG
jgi:hypothetical protein